MLSAEIKNICPRKQDGMEKPQNIDAVWKNSLYTANLKRILKEIAEY